MSAVRNAGAERIARAAILEPRALDAEARDRVVAELAQIIGYESFVVREGRLSLNVPLLLVLAHVEDSALLAAVGHLRRYAEAVVRAAATLDGRAFCDWAHGFGCVSDEPGYLVHLLADGAIRFDALGDGGNIVVGKVEEEAAARRVALGDPVGERLDRRLDQVAEDDLLRAEHPSLDHPDLHPSLHPDPIVPRRERPPP